LQEFLDGTNPTNAASALFRITLLNDGGTVTISPDQPTYTSGQAVTLTASSTNSNPFHAWTGDVVTRSNSFTVAMTANLTLFSHFLPFTLVWTNLLSGDWNLASNWSPNLVPGNNESVLLATSATITQNSNVDLVDFTLGNSVTSPTLTGSGRITIAGTGLWNSGTMSGTGATVVDPGASLTMATGSGFGLALNNRTLENAGSVVWVGGSFSLGGVITNDAGAQFQLAGPATINPGSGALRFDNAGTLILADSAATAFVGVAFDNYGTVNFPSGTLTLSGGGFQGGTLPVPAGAALNLAGGTFTSSSSLSITGGGALLVSGGNGTLAGTINVTGSNVFSSGSMDFTGSYIRTNAPLAISGCAVSFDGTSLVSPTVLTLSGGGLGGSSVVTVGSLMNWTGGSMTGSGRTVIPPGVTLNISNAGVLFITGRTLDNGGTVLMTGGGFGLNGGVITNESGALFQAQSPSTFSFSGGSPHFDNSGTLRLTGAGTLSFAGLPLNNFGLVDIQGGTLNLSGGGTQAGAVTVPAGTSLNFAGGAFTSSGSPSITGAGTFIVSGGIGTLGGTINVSGSNVFSNGSMDFTGNYVCTNNALTISGAAVNFDGTGPVSPSVIDLSSGSLGGSDLVTAGSAMIWTGGSMTGSGRTLIPPGATLSINNPSFMSITSRTLDNAGITTWSGANINMSDGVITNEPGALFLVQSPSSIFRGGGSPRFDNAGTLNTPVSGTTIFDVALNNFNTLVIQGGTLVVEGGGLNTGFISVPAGAAISFSGLTFTSSAGSAIAGGGTLMMNSGNVTLSGVVNVTGSNIFANGSAELNGYYVCTNNVLTISGGTVNFDGTGPVSPPVINLSGGSLGGSNVVTVGSAMSWTSGTMSGTGRTVIPPGAALTIANPSFLTINNRTLENGGTTVWTGAGNINLNAAVITNRVGALFNLQNASLIFFGGGTPRFDNAGTFRKSVTTGTTTIGGSVPFTNYGTVDIQSGILAMSGGYASASNALLNCGIGGTTAGTNYAQLQVSGSVALNGTLSINLNNNYIPTTNDSFTVLTAGTRNGAFSSFSYPSNQVTMQLSNTTNSVIVRVTGVAASPPPPPLLLPLTFSGTNALLTWTAVSNVTYRLEFNPDLTPSNWNAIPGDVLGLSNTASKLDTLTPSNRFYRVQVLP
ncbi:MAG TPA: hypothetical protein VN281_07295, partial [Verrucomicrobiae bacterium]|nr:hypothetical protein [Verrucomicrobiae bacterium]